MKKAMSILVIIVLTIAAFILGMVIASLTEKETRNVDWNKQDRIIETEYGTIVLNDEVTFDKETGLGHVKGIMFTTDK